MAKGTIDEDDVLAILPRLKSERSRLKADLDAEEPTTNIIEIKPKAVTKFRENIESPAEILKNRGAEPSIEMAKAFREVVSGVVVYPRKAGEQYQYEIKGWLLSGIAGPDSLRMVAEEGQEPPNRTNSLKTHREIRRSGTPLTCTPVQTLGTTGKTK